MAGKKQRKTRIYLKQGAQLYGFCWIEFLLDGSFSFGIRANIDWLEYGSAIHRDGNFVGNEAVITAGNAAITEVRSPHVTFHPPRINQEAGVARFADGSQKVVDQWSINWYPVKEPQVLIIVECGVGALPKESSIRIGGQIGVIPGDVEYIRMHLAAFPKGTPITAVHDPSALLNFQGHCPKYTLGARVYRNTVCKMGVYMATDVFNKLSHT